MPTEPPRIACKSCPRQTNFRILQAQSFVAGNETQLYLVLACLNCDDRVHLTAGFTPHSEVHECLTHV